VLARLSLAIALSFAAGLVGPDDASAQRIVRPARRVRASRPRPVRPLTPRRSWKQRGEVRDVTARFTDHYRRAAAGRPVLPPEARQLVYLIVPGAMGHQVPRYMAQTQRHLESLGLEVHRSRIRTTAGVAENAATLRDEVLRLSRGKRSVVLITHSKGGVDALAADAIHREIRPHLRARVLMQPPWGGTPLADMLDGTLSRSALRLVSGSPALIDDLKGAARASFSAAHRFSLAVPTVTLATSHTGWSALTPIAALLRRRGAGDSDGVVPQRSQLVPGSHVVRLDRLDHWSAVLDLPGSDYQPGPLAEALVAIALSIR
jgi:hypothetical protein